MFSAEFEQRVDALVARYPEQKAAMLMVLWEVQKDKGWIDPESEAWVAERLGTSPAQVHGVVSFYTMYKQKPMGRHHIQVCTTLSCMLRGSDELMDHLKGKLGIDEGEVTADGKFSLVRVECLGSCDTAPVVQVNDDYYEGLTPEKLEGLLEEWSR